VKIDLAAPGAGTPVVRAGPELAAIRARPSVFQYDYLTLAALRRDVVTLLDSIPAANRPRAALDVGSESSPYRSELEARGFVTRTLDLSPGSGADYTGTAEQTGLPAASFDLVLCTQVLEHCPDPWAAVREMRRILRPEGHLLVSVPHVWFFHPHPADHWRFTQQGLAHLCTGAGFDVRMLLGQGGSALAGAQVLNFLAYGVLGRAGAPFYAFANAAGAILDRLVHNDLFCINFACLARKAAAP